MPVNPYAVALGRLGGQQESWLPPLPPEQEASLIRQVLGQALGGLEAVGNLLDIPGSMARDVLTLNNPLDQLMDPLGREGRITGRDMLSTWGVASPNDPNRWELADFAGFGAEVLTDPLAYLTLGGAALSRGGQVAKNAGLMDDLTKIAGRAGIGTREAKTTTTLGQLLSEAGPEALPLAQRAAEGLGTRLDDLTGETLGGAFGLGLPFRPPAVTFGGAKAGRALDTAAEAVANIPGVPLARSLFDKAVRGQAYRPAQKVLGPLHRKSKAVRAAANEAMWESFEGVPDFRNPDETVQRALAAYSDLGDQYRQWFPDLPEISDEAKGAINTMQSHQDELYSKLGQTGYNVPQFESKWGNRHFFRSGAMEARKRMPGNPQAFDTTSEVLEARKLPIRDVPGGREQIDRLVQDARFVGPEALKSGPRIRTLMTDVYRVQPSDMKRLGKLNKALKQMPKEERAKFIESLAPDVQQLHETFTDAKRLSRWLGQRQSTEGRVFGRHILQDHRDYQVAIEGLTETADSIHRMFADVAKPVGEAEEGWLSLKEAFGSQAMRQAGFKNTAAALAKQLDTLGQRANVGDVDSLLDNLMVPPEAVETATKILKTFSQPEEVSKLVQAIDSFTNFFKLGVTAWPAFHSRNLVSGMVQNVFTDAYGPGKMFGYARDAYKMMRGDEAIEGLSKRPGIKRLFGDVDDATATRKLRQLTSEHNVVQYHLGEIHGAAEEAAPRAASAMESLLGELPGHRPLGLKNVLTEPFREFKAAGKADRKAMLKPWEVAGIGGRRTDRFIPARIHRDLGNTVEGTVRTSGFLGYLDQGLDPLEAARRVTEAHVDYKNLSQFERTTMRRLAPFYTFIRGITEHVAKTLIEHPGGKLAQFGIRAPNKARSDEQFVPPYIGEGLAIPLGGDRFLGSFGLMHEAPFEMLGLRRGLSAKDTLPMSAQRAGEKLLASTNPLIKAPLEMIAQRSFFAGRPLDELYPYPMEPTPFGTLVNSLLSSSPFSRSVRGFRTLTDERKDPLAKGVNLLTGASLTDVSGGIERQKELAASKATKALLDASPRVRSFERQYVPEELRGQLTPTELQLLRLQASQTKRAREAAKERALR